LSEATGDDFISIRDKEELTSAFLSEVRPRYIFLPHWSFIVPREIFEKYECVVFHMTDLPFGRGGSPLQNLIARGIYETKVSAIRCEAELDAGPVYLKTPLSLHGSAEEIYLRAAAVVRQMIIQIIQTQPLPKPQQGDPTYFKRRTPAQSDISEVQNLGEVFDMIRMLDAQGYPHAFLKTSNLRFEFRRASLTADAVLAEVRITVNKETDES
jgi:methionyl-tRNA formyltransferase